MATDPTAAPNAGGNDAPIATAQVVTSEPEVIRTPTEPTTGAPAGGPAVETQAKDVTTHGVGTEGEIDLWTARYSMKNFIGRIVVRIVLTIAWIVLAAWVWGGEAPVDEGRQFLAIIAGLIVLAMWLWLGWQIVRARLGHFYRLTNRRLFVSSGVFNRRRDQVELLSIRDVYVRQPSLLSRMLSVGTVVVESSEAKYPVTYLTGIDQPKAAADLLWHHARAERDRRTVKVDRV